MNTGIEPEKGWTVEGGIGLNFKGLAKFDSNVYYMRIDNEIMSYFIPPLTSVTENLDPIDRRGTNIGINLTPIKYVELDLDYGFVNAVFTEGDYEHNYVPLVPEQSLSASIMLHTPFGLSFGPNILCKDEFYSALDNENAQKTIESSMIWGFHARYTTQKITLRMCMCL
ncbi:MAG: TonB-dependent receptor [Spirochaetaceae bacterium]|jgi:outer membrane receptor protein involved in Fe transport|nr:TonB-dependent receptor [Spirochaetaceae bacterium]